MSKQTCPRCGKSTHPSSYDVHRVVCVNVPRPYTIAQMFLDDETVTQSALAHQYNVSSNFIRYHLHRGLMEHGYDKYQLLDLIQERANKNKSQNNRKLRYQRKATIPKGYEPCSSCGILVRGGGICRICSGEVACDYHGRVFRVGVGA